MSRVAEVLAANGISVEQLTWHSSHLEALGDADLALKRRRARKRVLKPEATYIQEGVAKPKSGRGISMRQALAAQEGSPLPRRVRAKIARALNHLLAKAGKPAVPTHDLFAGAAVKVGGAAKVDLPGKV